jgi:hypothetical protein
MPVELIICFRVYVGLHRSQRNDVPNLRTNTNDARFKGAQLGGATAVRGKLLIKIGLQEIEWVFLATSERWKHACEHLEPQIFLVA